MLSSATFLHNNYNTFCLFIGYLCFGLHCYNILLKNIEKEKLLLIKVIIVVAIEHNNKIYVQNIMFIYFLAMNAGLEFYVYTIFY